MRESLLNAFDFSLDNLTKMRLLTLHPLYLQGKLKSDKTIKYVN